MVSGLEDAGALMTAGAAAREIDPSRATEEVHEGNCLNCGAPLHGAYCSNCGQKAHLHRSVLHAVEEFLHGILHFDSKLWNTLPLLIFRPGKLTRDYVMGHRARYIAPVALFLLTIFTTFLVFGFMPTPVLNNGEAIQMTGKDREAAAARMKAELSTVDAELATARGALKADPGNADLSAEVKRLETAQTVADAAMKQLESGGVAASATDLIGALSDASKSGEMKMNLTDKNLEAKIRRALGDPEFMFYKMKQKGYKLSFLLVPLSLPWMLLLFAWKRGVKPYDHVVFLLYSISFMSMLALVAMLLSSFTNLPSGFYAFLLIVVPVAHMFAQLKEGYALGWFSAAWRTVALATLAVVTLAGFFVGILLLGLLD
ncbi:DUF3667 domain-containing protein [Sandaracinobacter neustonicus]|uniref:DUF3667 domain-containing protein n=1 Tax=Sandaracinobacter neustonicus TaxID=1715348 RepID=A0A501XVF5_9SPHN|nr:DUF3667 domain-containing protein [Sandaracinobacter neustonicus]TPE64586.1 DUF3667 domain-containing protein [Sandaracinobacter neustonicus]